MLRKCFLKMPLLSYYRLLLLLAFQTSYSLVEYFDMLEYDNHIAANALTELKDEKEEKGEDRTH